jgi:hypothetical protein
MRRSLPALLSLLIFGLALYLVVQTSASSNPADTALRFLKSVAAHDLPTALGLFGDNTCHCAPKGGYVAYLRYDAANDPSLAFLLGQKFTIGRSSTKALPFNGEKYTMPWDKPEDVVVYVPLTFQDANSRPYFLPMDMAFGKEVSSADLKKFAADPSREWMKAFTLRLRPRLTPDVIERTPLPPEQEEESRVSKLAQGVLPADILKYQKPAEASPMKNDNGELQSAQQIAGDLPRLKTITVGFKIVRAGIMNRWGIKKLGIIDPVIVCGNKEYLLKEPEQASTPKPND